MFLSPKFVMFHVSFDTIIPGSKRLPKSPGVEASKPVVFLWHSSQAHFERGTVFFLLVHLGNKLRKAAPPLRNCTASVALAFATSAQAQVPVRTATSGTNELTHHVSWWLNERSERSTSHNLGTVR